MTTPPVVVLTDAFGVPYDSNFIEAIEGTIYPLVFAVSDPDNPGAFFSDDAFFISGPDADQFYIVDTQLIFNYEPDYESPVDQGAGNTYEISVRITDPDGDFTDRDIIINIYDDPNDNNMGDQPPQFVSDPFAIVPENTGDVVYTAQVDNSGAGNAEDVMFSIVGGPDELLFSIDPTTGEVVFNEPPDYENPTDAGADNTYEIVVGAISQQSLLSALLDVEIFVTDENDEAPVLPPDDAVTVLENTSDVVYVAAATDADANDAVTYAITGGADSDKLSIDSLTGEVFFNQAPDFEQFGDADGDNTYEIEIVAMDNAGNE
jgi:Cadherin domain